MKLVLLQSLLEWSVVDEVGIVVKKEIRENLNNNKSDDESNENKKKAVGGLEVETISHLNNLISEIIHKINYLL